MLKDMRNPGIVGRQRPECDGEGLVLIAIVRLCRKRRAVVSSSGMDCSRTSSKSKSLYEHTTSSISAKVELN